MRQGSFDQGFFVLSWLGLLSAETVEERIALSAAGEATFDYSSSSAVTIVADFSAIIPQETQPDGIARFLRIGKLGTLDRVYKGEITKELITSSLSAGFRGDDLLTILELFCAPVNVASSVREWIREFSRASILDSGALVVCDERTASQIVARQQILELVEEIPCVKLFRIREGQRTELESRLVAMGFDPRFPLLTEAHEEETELPGAPTDRFKVVSDFLAKQNTTVAVAAGKYSSDLKVLEHADLMHVLNYSILMGHRLKLEVEAFPGTKAGEYSLLPEKIGRYEGADAVIGAAEGTRAGKQIPIKKILRIGVLYE